MQFAPSRLACHHCGAVYRRVPLEKDHLALCVRCDTVLETKSEFSANSWLAIVITAMMTFTLAKTSSLWLSKLLLCYKTNMPPLG